MSRKTIKEKLNRYFSNNFFLVTIWIVVVTFSSLITIVDGQNILRDFLQNKVFYTRTMYRKLSNIRPGVNIEYLANEFGTPVYKNKIAEELYEYIFVYPEFYLQAITYNDSVIRVAITTRNSSFKPTFNPPGLMENHNTQVTLNETLYSEFSQLSSQCLFFAGVRRYGYAESYYLGNPSNYQTFYLAINDAGNRSVDDDNIVSLLFDKQNTELQIDCDEIDDSTREMTFNTYIITDKFDSFAELYADTAFVSAQGIFLGIDYDEVRILY